MCSLIIFPIVTGFYHMIVGSLEMAYDKDVLPDWYGVAPGKIVEPVYGNIAPSNINCLNPTSNTDTYLVANTNFFSNCNNTPTLNLAINIQGAQRLLGMI